MTYRTPDEKIMEELALQDRVGQVLAADNQRLRSELKEVKDKLARRRASKVRAALGISLLTGGGFTFLYAVLGQFCEGGLDVFHPWLLTGLVAAVVAFVGGSMIGTEV